MQGHKKNSEKNKNKTWYIVIIYCYIGCEDKVSTIVYIETRTKRAHDLDIFNVIQKVQDTVIHLEVDEKQWKITQESKRQAKCMGMVPTYDVMSTASRYSSCSTPTQRSTRLDRKQKEYLSS